MIIQLPASPRYPDLSGKGGEGVRGGMQASALSRKRNIPYYFSLPLAANAERSSRPLTPSPLYEGGGGVGATFDFEGFNGSFWRTHICILSIATKSCLT